VETALEVRIEVKTTAGRLGALRERLRELHPHEVPELVVLAAAGGLGSYLDWVRESTTAEA
jgi:periplasmic divalent cation tolerance protein